MRKNVYLYIVIALCIGCIITFAYSVYADSTEKALSDGIIRLHVIANSDSDPDQNLKLKVRDAIVEQAGHLFTDDSDKASAQSEILANMEKIKKIASGVIADYGYDYPVEVVFGKSDFPTKVYGNITLPAGAYDALKVIIGSGEGKNWWCVLFPPLCFVDATTANMSCDGNEILKDSLSESQYQMITESNTLPVQVKFKTYELWQQSKIKLKNMFAMTN